MGTENQSGRRPRRKSGGRRRRSGKGSVATDAATDSREAGAADNQSATGSEAAAGGQATPSEGSETASAVGTKARTAEAESNGSGDASESRSSRRRSRGKRGGRGKAASRTNGPAGDGASSGDSAPVERPEPAPSAHPASESSDAGSTPSNGSESTGESEASTSPSKKRSRGGRRRRGKVARGADVEGKPEAGATGEDESGSTTAPSDGDAERGAKPEKKTTKKKRRRSRGARTSEVAASNAEGDADDADAGEQQAVLAFEGDAADATDDSKSNGESKPARSRRRGGRGRRAAAEKESAQGNNDATEKESAKATGKSTAASKSSERLMLINTKEPEEVRVAILDDRELDDLLFESTAQTSYLNNIYLGRVVNIEPSIGAAFVDFGGDRNGFLHESDIVTGAIEANRQSPKSALAKTSRGERRPIQDLVRKGQSVLVQITKDGIGSKGPTLTTNVSIPGRYLVLMPYLGRCGVSRKIPDKDERKRLKTLLGDLEPPADLGVIIRTAGVDRTKSELQKDLRYLLRLWDVISNRIEGGRAPATIYLESDLIIRTIRDYFTGDISRVLVDSEAVARKCTDFLRQVMPRYCNRVEHYSGKHPLFHEYGIEPQIEQIYRRRIDLPSGGSVVIEQTEALVAVDVNSGKYRENEDPEETAYRTDLEAIPVIVRQIRLRDLGGLLIIDFIDMQKEKHKRTVERELRAALKRDRARAKMTRMSEFGIIEITRQRVRAGLGRANFVSCPHCRGAGQIKTVESQVLAALRQIRALLARDRGGAFDVAMHPQVASVLLNDKRRQLAAIEEEFSKTVRIHGQAGAPVEEFRATRVPI